MSQNRHDVPRKPTGLKGGGLRLWNKITTEFGMETSELAVLEEVCRTKTRIDQLDKIVDAEGLVIESPQGKKVHPAAVESRQVRNVFNQLAKTLRFPVEEDSK